MTIHDTPLAHLRRPRLLVSAARFGLSAFQRESVLRRLFGTASATHGQQMLGALASLECEIDDERRAGAATYSVARHVEVLTALIAEARLAMESTRASVS